MPILDTAGAEIYYETAGSGTPLVLIPGFASGRWSWFGQKDLEKDLQLISYDPRGIGMSRSDKTANDLSLNTFAGDVLHILDELAIEKASILGTSFGGFVALAFALQFPERVDKLILACTTAGGPEHVTPDIEILRSFTRNPEYTVGEQIRRFFRPAFTEEFNTEHAEIVEKVCRLREENEVDEDTYVAQLRTAYAFDVSAQLGHIQQEALVITGDSDNLVPMQNSEKLAAKLPNATLRIIKDGSHMIFVENAKEFNQIVAEFLNK